MMTMMLDLKYEELYNGHLKKIFIEETYDNASSKATIFSHFKKVKDKEFELNKDISQMTEAEIEDMLLGVTFSTQASANNHINTYKRYAEKFVGTTHNFNGFGNLALLAERVVAKQAQVRYTRKQIEEIVETLYNDTDQALILCFFEGIKGLSYSEILNMKPEHLHHTRGKYKVTLFDDKYDTPRTIEISKLLYGKLIAANNQPSYTSRNGELIDGLQVETRFNKSQYIFKKTMKGKQEQSRLDSGFIRRKMVFLKELLEDTYITADDIVRSGMLHMAHELYQDYGVLGKKELLIIGEQFNTPLTTYKGEKIRNITNLKKEIFSDALYRVYPDMIGVEYFGK